MTSSPDQPAAAATPTRERGIPPALADRVGYLIARSHHLCHALGDDALRPLGLTVKHYGCLAVIADEGPVSQQTLGTRMNVDRTTMVAVVDELEAKGMVARRRNPADRRAYALEATAEGRRARRRAAEGLNRYEEQLLVGLSADERDRLRELLTRLIAGAEGFPAP